VTTATGHLAGDPSLPKQRQWHHSGWFWENPRIGSGRRSRLRLVFPVLIVGFGIFVVATFVISIRLALKVATVRSGVFPAAVVGTWRWCPERRFMLGVSWGDEEQGSQKKSKRADDFHKGSLLSSIKNPDISMVVSCSPKRQWYEWPNRYFCPLGDTRLHCEFSPMTFGPKRNFLDGVSEA
jgi:hypothetical protein